MAARREKVVVTAYGSKAPLSREVFESLWRHLGEAPFSAQRYDQVERMKHSYSDDASEEAYALYAHLCVLVCGRSATLTLSLAHPLEKVAMWSLWIDGKAFASPASQQLWIDWLVSFFSMLPTYFAMVCTESEFNEKHRFSVEVAGGYTTVMPGWRPPDFARALPGVYWGNYYDSKIAARLGAMIRSNESLVVREADDGALLATLNEPLVPNDLKARIALERKIAGELGREYFFDKAEPDARRHQIPELAEVLGSERDGGRSSS